MKGRLWFWAVAAAGAAADLTAKSIAFASIQWGEAVPVLPGVLNITRSLNRGGVWGILQGKGLWFLLFSAVAAAFVIWIAYTTPKSNLLMQISLGSVLAGAVGNMYDRLRFRGVRDFIDLHWGNHHWPTFNVADALICIAVGLMLIEMWRREPQPTSSDRGETPSP